MTVTGVAIPADFKLEMYMKGYSILYSPGPVAYFVTIDWDRRGFREDDESDDEEED